MPTKGGDPVQACHQSEPAGRKINRPIQQQMKFDFVSMNSETGIVCNRAGTNGENATQLFGFFHAERY
jgi:hypothetical protein